MSKLRPPHAPPAPKLASKEAPKIKGAAFLEILKWYAAAHGTERLRRAAHKMPRELKPFITRPNDPTLGILASTWYPSELVALVFHEMVQDLTPRASRQLVADAVKASVGTTLSGIYAGILRMLVSPKMLAEHYQKLWRLYHSTGEFQVIVDSPTRYEFRLQNWPGHDAFICQMNLHATKLILEMIGMREVTGQLAACVDKGSAYCSYVQSWRA
jgi:hypothetical protein